MVSTLLQIGLVRKHNENWGTSPVSLQSNGCIPTLKHLALASAAGRGHEQSADPGPNHAWSVDELLTDIKGFLDVLNLDRVHFVGESIGGLQGIACAVRHSVFNSSATEMSSIAKNEGEISSQPRGGLREDLDTFGIGLFHPWEARCAALRKHGR